MSKLIGTDPNQVPSNADLGSAAFMDKTEFVSSREPELSAIEAVIGKTAGDVFVYDTSRDSDGGAWRHRTQHTSWYNEPLNTEVRGSRREFPAVAVLVLESNSGGTEGETVDFTIYDADSATLTKWMDFRFKLGGGYNTGISAVNGVIVFGATDNGVLVTDFVADTLRVYNHVHRHSYTDIYPSRLGRTSDRAVNTESSITGYSIVNQTVYAVDTAVLPDAPVNPVTNLPIPTIAVATAGGTSVITDTGAVYDIGGFAPIDAVNINEHRLQFSVQITNTSYTIIGPARLTADIAASNWDSTEDQYDSVSGTNGTRRIYTNLGRRSALANSGEFMLGGTDPGGQSPHPNGLLKIITSQYGSSDNLKANIMTDSNSGWMHSHTRFSVMCGTDATPIHQKDYVVNGSFDNGTTGWTIVDAAEGSFSVSGGQLTLNNSTATNPPVAVYQAISLTPGKYYNLISEHVSGNLVVCNISETVTSGGGTGDYGNVVYHDVAGSTRAATFMATSTSNYLILRVNTNATGTSVMESVSIREVEPDTSIYREFLRDRPSGFTVVGNLNRQQVAANSDLVAYSGFSSGNYLIQPYNDQLEVGTNPVAIMCWIYPTNYDTTEQYIFNRRTTDPASNKIELRLLAGGTIRIYSGSNFSDSTRALELNQWNHVVVQRYNNSRGWHVYLNGENVTSAQAITSPDNLSQAGAECIIGNRLDALGTYQLDRSSIAMLKFSSGVPLTEKQIKKIYNDERMLYQDNAKSTLYGTSNDVTAIAYDEKTQLTHVGTSDGRSVFRELQRVDNTTRAVTQSLSAYNGLVAEE